MTADRGAVRSRDDAGADEDYEAYFAEVSDGCGCAEIWEYLSERRREE